MRNRLFGFFISVPRKATVEDFFSWSRNSFLWRKNEQNLEEIAAIEASLREARSFSNKASSSGVLSVSPDFLFR